MKEKIITQKSLKKCNINHSKYVNGEKIKKNIFKDEEPVIRYANESLVNFWKRKMSRYHKLGKFYNSSKMKRRRWFRKALLKEYLTKILTKSLK